MGKIDAKVIVRDIEKAAKSETKKLNFFVKTVADSVDKVAKDYADEYDAVYSGVKNKLKRFFSSKRKGDLKSYLKSVEEDIDNVGILSRGVERLRAKGTADDKADAALNLLILRLQDVLKKFEALRKKAGGKSAKKAFDVGEIAGKAELKPTKNAKYGAAFASEDYDTETAKKAIGNILEPVSETIDTILKENEALKEKCKFDYLNESDFNKVKKGYFDPVWNAYLDLEKNSSKEKLVSLRSVVGGVIKVKFDERNVKTKNNILKEKFEIYLAEIKKRSAFADVLKTCHVFDSNMGATLDGKTGKITKSSVEIYKKRTKVDVAPDCLTVALGGKLVQQYDHSKDGELEQKEADEAMKKAKEAEKAAKDKKEAEAKADNRGLLRRAWDATTGAVVGGVKAAKGWTVDVATAYAQQLLEKAKTKGPYYQVIDKDKNCVTEANSPKNTGKGATFGSINASSDEKEAIDQVIKVLQDSLKAGEWMPIK